MKKVNKPVCPSIILAAIFLSSALPSILLTGCASEKPESLVFGCIPSGSAALVYIAQEEGFFKERKLSVEVKDYNTGVATIGSLLANEIDFAWSAEFPLVRAAFSKEKISVIAVIEKFQDQYLICRKDRGVAGISDVEGKKVGVAKNTIADFYLSRFFNLNGISSAGISYKNVSGKEFTDSIVSGRVDCVVAWEPQSSEIKALLSDSAVSWPIQSSQAGYGVVICRNEWLSSHEGTVDRFLSALMRSEEFLSRNEAKAKNIVRERISYTDAEIERFWGEAQFSLSLDQSLVIAMEDESRWMISNNLTREREVPNFLDYIYEAPLMKIKPIAVNIIR